MDKIETLRQWVKESKNIVAFTGAGVSTESGVPDFRSVDGLYSQKFEYPPETIISHSFYLRNPEYFFRFYREKMMPMDVEPNITHVTLARWEREGRLLAVVTQNIDGHTCKQRQCAAKLWKSAAGRDRKTGRSCTGELSEGDGKDHR